MTDRNWALRHARIALALLSASLLFGLSFLPASADSGDYSDPRDAEGKLDVKAISHTNDDESVTYRVETFDGFDNERDLFLLRWDFDLDGDDVTDDACVLLQHAGSEGDPLRASLIPSCGQDIWTTVDARKVSGNVVEVEFALSDLVRGAGFPTDDRFTYRVTATDLDGRKDTAPDGELLPQEGLPSPAKAARAPAARAGSESTQSSGQDARTSDGSDPPVAEGIGDDVIGGDVGGNVDPRAGTTDAEAAAEAASDESSGSPLVWALAIGLPGLVLILVLFALRRRGKADVGVALPEFHEASVGSAAGNDKPVHDSDT